MVVEEINKLRNACGKENVFITFDNTKSEWKKEYENMLGIDETNVLNAMNGVFNYGNTNVLLIEESSMKLINHHHNMNKECYETPWVLVHRMLPKELTDYDYMWSIENDVYCNGDWSMTLRKADPIVCDFLTDMIIPFEYEKGWPDWAWKRIYGWDVEDKEKIKCFSPICRMSRKMMEVMDRELGKRSGFLELYPSTLCKHEGLTMAEMPRYMLAYNHWEPRPIWWLQEEISKWPNAHRLYHPIKM
jgi:hypothetical protein